MLFIFLLMVTDLQVKIIFEVFFPPQQRLLSLMLSYVEYFIRYFSIDTTAQHNDILLVFLDQLFVYSGNIVKSIDIRCRRQLGQIMVSVFILGKKHHLISIVFKRFIQMVLTNIEFTPHNWLYRLIIILVVIQYFLDENKSAHHITCICQGNSGHLIGTGGMNQILDTGSGL